MFFFSGSSWTNPPPASCLLLITKSSDAAGWTLPAATPFWIASGTHGPSTTPRPYSIRFVYTFNGYERWRSESNFFLFFFYYSFSFSLFIITASFNNRFRVPHTFGPRQNFKKERIINARRPSFIIIYTHKFRAVLAATLSFCVLVKLIIIRRVIHHLGQSPARFRFSYGREKMCLTGAVEFAKLWGVKRMSQQWRVNIQIRHKRN